MIDKVPITPEMIDAALPPLEDFLPEDARQPRVLPSFTDARGDRWQIDINVSTIKRVKKALDFDLLDALGKPEQFQRLYLDPILLCDLLFVLCQEQTKERSIDDEQFGARLAGDAIELATDALVAGIADFFPKGRRRKLLKREAARIRAMESRALEIIDRLVAAKGKELESQIEQRVTDFGARSTSSPESSAATPALTPSAS